MPLVTASPDWDHTLLIVTFDEGTTSINGGGHVYTAAAAPWLPHADVATTYNHFSVLRTIEEVYGLPFLGSAATATTMTELLPPSPTPTPTSTPTATATATATIAPTSTPTPTPTPTPTATPTSCDLIEGFENVTTLVPNGWVMLNRSLRLGTTGWFQANSNFGWLGGSGTFGAQSGSPVSYIAANFLNGSGQATISNWLLTPPVTLQNGAKFSFWTRTGTSPVFPDRLQVRMSTNGTSQDVGTTATDVGDFTTLLLDINPTYTTSGYPNVWTNFLVTLSGLGGPVTGRLAFRYFVENGGPSGANSDYIGIDAVAYGCNGNPPTPSPTPSPTSTPTPTPGTPVSFISGTILYCSSPLPNVRVNVTGTVTGSTLSDGSGNYRFRFLPWAGSFTVTPSKAALAPGTSGINTIDVLAVQRHFIGVALLPPGCRLTAADVNGDAVIDTIDVIAIQRFFLGLSTGIANTGQYQFTPASRSYTGNGTNWTAQNYDMVLFGDCLLVLQNDRMQPMRRISKRDHVIALDRPM